MTSTGISYGNIVSTNFTRHRKVFVPLEQLMSFDYVRETSLCTSNPKVTIERRRRPLFGEQHNGLIGYAVVGKIYPYLYNTLIWWHKRHDRDIQPEGPYQLSPHMINDPSYKHAGPCEAVAPSRVLEFFPELTEWC